MEQFNITGMRCIGQVVNTKVNGGRPVPLFEPVPPAGRPSINTMEGWNAAAERANTRAFNQVFGRNPACSDELMAWERSGFDRSFSWAGEAQ